MSRMCSLMVFPIHDLVQDLAIFSRNSKIGNSRSFFLVKFKPPNSCVCRDRNVYLAESSWELTGLGISKWTILTSNFIALFSSKVFLVYSFQSINFQISVRIRERVICAMKKFSGVSFVIWVRGSRNILYNPKFSKIQSILMPMNRDKELNCGTAVL